MNNFKADEMEMSINMKAANKSLPLQISGSCAIIKKND